MALPLSGAQTLIRLLKPLQYHQEIRLRPPPRAAAIIYLNRLLAFLTRSRDLPALALSHQRHPVKLGTTNDSDFVYVLKVRTTDPEFIGRPCRRSNGLVV